MIGQPERRHELEPVGYLEMTLADATVAAIPAEQIPAVGDTGEAVVVVHYTGGPFRFRVDGEAPSPTNGWPAADGDAQDLNGYEAAKWRVCLAAEGRAGVVRAGIYVRRRR